MKTVRFEKDGFGDFLIIDNRNDDVLRRNVKTPSKAAAFVRYYEEEIVKAEKLWSDE
jgi:hypothetical protein